VEAKTDTIAGCND